MNTIQGKNIKNEPPCIRKVIIVLVPITHITIQINIAIVLNISFIID